MMVKIMAVIFARSFITRLPEITAREGFALMPWPQRVKDCIIELTVMSECKS